MSAKKIHKQENHTAVCSTLCFYDIKSPVTGDIYYSMAKVHYIVMLTLQIFSQQEVNEKPIQTHST